MFNRPATPRQAPRGPVHRFLLRRIWLPGPVYAALPFLYLLLAAFALVSGIYLPDPGWIFSYLLLISVGCLHAGVLLMLLRRRRRHSRLRQHRAQRGPGAPVQEPAAGL